MSREEVKDRSCQECGIAVYGREDKKFCSDQCRNSWNNRENKQSNDYIRKVVARIKKNRKILVELNPDGKRKVPKDELTRRGFDFEFFTSVYVTKKEAKEYRFCFDQGYMELSPGWYILVVKKEYN